MIKVKNNYFIVMAGASAETKIVMAEVPAGINIDIFTYFSKDFIHVVDTLITEDTLKKGIILLRTCEKIDVIKMETKNGDINGSYIFPDISKIKKDRLVDEFLSYFCEKNRIEDLKIVGKKYNTFLQSDQNNFEGLFIMIENIVEKRGIRISYSDIHKHIGLIKRYMIGMYYCHQIKFENIYEILRNVIRRTFTLFYKQNHEYTTLEQINARSDCNIFDSIIARFESNSSDIVDKQGTIIKKYDEKTDCYYNVLVNLCICICIK